ncbi:DUF664 domain-containing protein, partial [Streptomyces sp. NPDC059409]|uniref:mycothiol transferase n=1 Tax=Streptomyces sp. NPDC059409 TaxID=3346824 RepID=UPI0036AA7B82
MSTTQRRDTPPPRTGNDEAATLRGFLDYLRTSIAGKVEGAPEPQVRTAAVPSGTHLLGLLTHLTHVERAVFLGAEVRSWPATFRAAPQDGVAEVAARDPAARAPPNTPPHTHTPPRPPPPPPPP